MRLKSIRSFRPNERAIRCEETLHLVVAARVKRNVVLGLDVANHVQTDLSDLSISMVEA